ncbi:hypothetical protein F5Y10DRAFT_64626 [Nemania abortiva]|nr:hypothetical protein F5Y10DRAFT_64626 [Nemania abortiva]
MAADMQQRNPPSISGQLAAAKRKRADTNSSAEPTITSNKRQCLTSSLGLPGDDDAKVLNAVDARYEVQLQSVISSSKIQKRVSAILRYLTPPVQSSSIELTSDTVNPKPKSRVSVLRAKAADAGKLVSIAEIAKREIERERSTSDGVENEAGQEREAGRWFQYIVLGEELQQKQRIEESTIIEETVLGGMGADGRDHEEDDEFEVMKTPFERAIQGRPLVRGVPVMSLFLSRSPIEELKKRYGEQTNAPPT